jgi:hypothetical protein
MAATNNNALVQLLIDVVLNFGMAYAATQELLQSNTVNILASRGSLKCSARQLALASPHSNSHDTHGVDMATASNVVATMAAVTVAGVVAVAAITLAVVAAMAAAAVAMQTAVATLVVAMATAAATAAGTAAATSDIRPQAASPPHQENMFRTGTTASRMAAT